MQQTSIRVSIEIENALRFRADVLVLKHAQAHYGVDGAVFERLSVAGTKLNLPKIGAHHAVASGHALGVDRVLFLGVEPLSGFGLGSSVAAPWRRLLRTSTRRATSH